MTVFRFLVVLVVFHLNFVWNIARGDVSVSCEFKQNCILPCTFRPGPELVIHWIQTTGNIQVHSFYHNQDKLGYQDQRFKGRTSIFKDQVSSGNASLQLTGVEFQDEGRYKCYTSVTSGNQESFINVIVDVPVQKVNINQEGNMIFCMSGGIYPEPKLTWSTEPSSPLAHVPNPHVQRDGQLYSISSSLTLLDSDTDLTYSCTISTRKNTKTSTLFKPTSITCPDSEITIPCTDSNTLVTNLVWRFNHSQLIVTQMKSGGTYTVSDKWRQYVKDASKIGTLTLQKLSSDQNGIYTCELTNDDTTLVKTTVLQITEGQTINVTGIAIGVVVAVLALAPLIFLVVRHLRRNTQEERQHQREQRPLNSASNQSENETGT
ncbi:V-set domain-containing T-cell activation inhibitor 1-like [Pelmatolapia mariae]|uniref:V-set domain-containing T-cell activation inhibitor 1-like n=1 Tax=Pelmatolapia mariae TaxID=158779 RepID=UPI002FE659FF